MKRIDKNMFMFSFHHEVDAHRAFHRRPWSCKGGHLIIKKWSPDITWQEVDFSSSTFWVQVHGLPALWSTEDNLKRIGSRLGKVIEMDLVGEPGSVWKKFLRIRVDIPIEKPLLPGFFLPRPNNSDSWIGLKYEKLANIFYKCGVIGHEEKSCTNTLFQIRNPYGVTFKAAGPWLRPSHDNSPSGVSEHPTSDSNAASIAPEMSSEHDKNSVQDSGPRVASLATLAPEMSPERDNSFVQGSGPGVAMFATYNTHLAQSTKPQPVQSIWQPHDIPTSTTSESTDRQYYPNVSHPS